MEKKSLKLRQILAEVEALDKMAAPSGLPNGDHANDIHEMIRQLESGLVTTVFFSKRKPEKRTCRVKLETKQLLWIRNSRQEGAGKEKKSNKKNYCHHFSVSHVRKYIVEEVNSNT